MAEAWAAEQLYCANCESPYLERLRTNTAAKDFSCPKCMAAYQLKCQGHSFGRRIMDSAYEKMVSALRGDENLNLLALQYEKTDWRVVNLILVPRFALPISAIEKRKPLGPGAERAGWVGCNILLDRIPQDARIPIVREGRARTRAEVREAYRRLRPLEKLKAEKRGWTLDVLNVVDSLKKEEFELADVYAHEHTLARLHPENRHVRDKIRQQLQVLRDLGRVEFLGSGNYRLT